jgi:hypothetical protein
MRPWISQTRVGRGPATRLVCWCLLPCCLLLLAGGCRGRRAAEHMEVSGRVLFKGEPLPGGKVSFVADDGFSAAGVIDEKGNYSIKAPTGPARISVDNRMLDPRSAVMNNASAQKGAGPRPGGPEPEKLKGTYKQIPSKYYLPDQSGLTYEVTKETKQTHDIQLAD